MRKKIHTYFMSKGSTFFFVVLLAIIFISAQLLYGQDVSPGYANNTKPLHWQEVQTPHFTIVFPRRYHFTAIHLASQAEAIYREFRQRLGRAPDKDILLYYHGGKELISGAQAQGTGIAFDIWTHNLQQSFQRKIGKYNESLEKVLRHKISTVFEGNIRSAIFKYYYAFLYAQVPPPWPAGLLSYLAEPSKTTRQVSTVRTYFMPPSDHHKITKPFAQKYITTMLGRSQIQFFDKAFPEDSLQALYAYRTPLFGLFDYFDFKKAFQHVTGLSYRDFQKQWIEHKKQYIKKEKTLFDAESIQTGHVLFRPKKVQSYIGGSVNHSTNDVAYISQPKSGNLLQKLYVVETDTAKTGEARQISEGYFQPVIDWNPRGDQLVFSRQAYERKSGRFADHLYLWNKKNGITRPLISDQNAKLPDFSPDGRHIAYIVEKKQENSIWLQNIKTNSRKKLYTFSRGVSIGQLDFSPNGKQLLISFLQDDEDYQAGILTLADHKFMSLPLHADVPLRARWGSAGNVIYFDKKRHEVTNIFRANISGKSLGAIEPVISKFRGINLWDTAADSSGNTKILTKSGEALPFGKMIIYHKKPVADTTFSGTSSAKNRMRFSSSNTHNENHSDFKTKPYRSFLHTQLKLPIVLPYYASPDNFGIGTALEFQEPMRTHKFNISGLFSLDHPISKSYFFTKYTNNSFRPRLELHFNHFTSGALIIGRSRKVQMTNVVAASSLWKLSGLSQDFSDWYVGLQLRYMRFKYFSDERLHQKYPRFLYTNHAAHQTDLKAAVIWHNMKPSKNTFINPFSGAGVRLSVTGSDKILGSDTKYLRLNLGGYKILPGFGRNRIYLRLNGVMDLGAPAGRDYLNFASGGNFALTGPNFLGSVNPDINRFVRGYHKNILGDKFLFGRLEYRIPFEFNTTEKLFGVIPPARTVFTFFSDAGMMGNARVAPNRTATKRRWSAGFEIKRVLAAGGFQLAYEVGIGQPLTKAFGPHLYIRAQMAVPF